LGKKEEEGEEKEVDKTEGERIDGEKKKKRGEGGQQRI